jgi:glucose-6-phosphate isomerase
MADHATTPNDGPRHHPAWRALEADQLHTGRRHLRELFADDPDRGTRMRASGAGLELDYAKQRVTDTTLGHLIALANQCRLTERRQEMFAGERINVSERRSVLHVALRMPRSMRLVVDGADVVTEVHDVLERMGRFADAVRSGRWRGHTGMPITSVINIGIGGSDLGPVMANAALRPFAQAGLECRFVSNVDGDAILDATRDLDPAQTLIVVSSKTFTTRETMTNAHSARRWLVTGLGDEAAIARHAVAVSTNAQAVAAFGIAPENMFGFWDWVGGRYSMDSAIGLSTMIAIGPEGFADLLAGFHAMDQHFLEAPFAANLPVLMGLLAVWNRNFLLAPTTAVLPYSEHMHRFPAYLQQLTMESNGKHVTAAGHQVDYDTGAIVWGEPGTNGQHSFYQLLHQGTTIVPVDLIGFLRPTETVGDHHDFLLANLVAQAQALAFGRTEADLRADGIPPQLIPHKLISGNRPSNVILAESLTPHTLGALVALYEHSVFTQSVVWGIDAFDQWGVELGKQLATTIADEIVAPTMPTLTHDSSTNTLITRIRAARAARAAAG